MRPSPLTPPSGAGQIAPHIQGGLTVRKLARRLGIALLALAGLLAVLVLDFLRHGGQFTRLHPHFAGSCEELPLAASVEDIRIDSGRGLAYLSYLDRRALVERRPVRGTVMLLDLEAARPAVRAALATEPPDFRPHGMSLYRPLAGEGRPRLFVISHPRGEEHTVEIFEQSETGAFVPVETVRDPLLAAPNAIFAVGPRQFYVANDSGATSRFERLQELVFRRGLATLAYYDGSTMHAAATGLKSAAGLDGSADGRVLYVSETAGKRLHVFDRDPQSGALRSRETVDLGSAPDNVFVDPQGQVWIAAHAKVLALVRHFADAARPAPTQILRFLPAAAGDARLTEVFVDSGERLSAGSVAAVHGERMLLGSITERKLLLCRLPPDGEPAAGAAAAR